DFKLIVIGDAGFSISDIDVEAIAWTEEMELPTISRFDIGLYPLPDEEWVYGKSGLKAIQYMAMGIPTVATSIGTNFRVIQDGESGFLVKDEDEWIAAIKKLANDQVLRQRMGTKSAEIVEKKFSINGNKGLYLSIINKVISSGNQS
ncbi:MAG TPA: glycosyltransferase, partial [Chitinophagaceae bacterium]|nr:glycosyltransferase [Chitinophagaceae bacterium]